MKNKILVLTLVSSFIILFTGCQDEDIVPTQTHVYIDKEGYIDFDHLFGQDVPTESTYYSLQLQRKKNDSNTWETLDDCVMLDSPCEDTYYSEANNFGTNPSQWTLRLAYVHIFTDLYPDPIATRPLPEVVPSVGKQRIYKITPTGIEFKCERNY